MDVTRHMNALSAAFGAGLFSIAGCQDRATPADVSSASGRATTSTSALESSDGTGTAGATADGEPSSGTGDAGATGRARFVLWVELDDETRDARLLEFSNGEVGALIELLPDLPQGSTLSSGSVVNGGHILHLCWETNATTLETHCGVIDLSTSPPGPLQSLVTGPIPKEVRMPSMSMVSARWSAETQAFWFAPLTLEGEDMGLFAARFADGQLESSKLLVEPIPGQERSSFSISPDGALVTYTLRSSGDEAIAYVASTDPSDRTPAMAIGDGGEDGFGPTQALFLPTRSALHYGAWGQPRPSTKLASLWFVDVSGDRPPGPIRMDVPSAEPVSVRAERPAPDGHALTYWVGARDSVDGGELMWVDLSSGVPLAPVRVSTISNAAAQQYSASWSPNSRWLVYKATHEDPGTEDLYLVSGSGSTPGDPMLVSEGLVHGEWLNLWAFSPDSRWLYLVAPIDHELPRLFRVDVSGDSPGPLQEVEGPAGRVEQELHFSHDGTALLYPTYDMSRRQLAFLDSSGQPARRISAPLPEGHDVISWRVAFSIDDSVVAYLEDGPGVDSPQRLRLVDLAADGAVTAIDELNVVGVQAAVDVR